MALLNSYSVLDLFESPSFGAAFAWLEQHCIAPSEVLWVVPRTETVVGFKRWWAQYYNFQPSVGPWVQTADRLSQPASVGPWLALQADLVGILRDLPILSGGLSRSELWGLAQQYLELALRLVLARQGNVSVLAEYAQQNVFAAQEAQVVLHLAQTYEDELMNLLPKPKVAGKQPGQVVWFDDGEAMPGLWLQVFYPAVPVQVFRLPAIEGPAPWQSLAQARFACKSDPVLLQVAPDETTQVQQAAHQILSWLQQQPDTEVAIVVLDRLAARRLVSLLADWGVLVDDRTGWRLSTSNVSGWFDRLLTQYVEQKQLCHIEQPLTGAPLEHFEPWAFGKSGGRYRLAQWAEAFLNLFQKYQLNEVLQLDEAGQQLLMGLGLMRSTLAQTQFDSHEFLMAWRAWAESQRFRPQDIDSPVFLVPLLSTRMQAFKRVLVLGCAQSHFQESPPGLLPPAVAQELGLPGPRLARIQKISALYELLMHSGFVTLIHSAQAAGKPEMLLPELSWLDIVLHALVKCTVPGSFWSPLWYQCPENLEVAVNSQPEQPLRLTALAGGRSVPGALSVTALDDWAACGLRFGLKHALPWAAQPAQGAKSHEQLRGIFVHKVLERTAQHMVLAGQVAAQLDAWKQTLTAQAQGVWNQLDLIDRVKLYSFLKFFNQIVPRLAGQLMERHIQGWQFSDAEKQITQPLTLQPSGRVVVLKGRVDRLDVRGDARAIVDIKLTRSSVLKKRLNEPLSQPQLPAYQAMLNDPNAQLDFLSVNKEKVEWVSFPPLSDDWRELGCRSWGEVLFSQLSQELDVFFSAQAVWQAKPGQACEWCAVRGVCRPEFVAQLAQEEGEDE